MDLLKNMLTEIDSPFSPVEALGYLSGFSCVNSSSEDYNDALSMYFFSTTDNKDFVRQNLTLLRDIVASISKSITSKSFQFSFENEEDCSLKLISLADWTRNFVLSINYLLDQKLIKNSIDLQEILHDLSEIGNIEDKYSIGTDEDADNYSDISQYVLSSLYRINMELK